MSFFLDKPERLASYVVGPERTFYVTTIDYRNEMAPEFNRHESGIRDMTGHSDGREYPTFQELKEAIPFVLCQHDIYPLRAGHLAVVQALKDGAEPDEVFNEVYRDRLPCDQEPD